ncbi:MAG: MmcQ/YjbR family DNA-binding protein [Clostridiaceae bacterium]
MKKSQNENLKKTILKYALSKKKAVSEFPFDEETEVIKVMDKIFLLVNNEEPFEISLKCNPVKSIELRELFEFITPGYHLNKKHWITVTVNRSMPIEFFFELIDHSYAEVVKKLTKVKKEELLELA